MADSNPLWLMKEIGGVLKLGSGLLGKSAIALSIWEGIILIAVVRLQSDWAIMSAIALGGIGFFVWYFPVISFAKKNPAEALLEGAEWSGFQRYRAEAKGYMPSANDLQQQSLPNGATLTLSVENGIKQPEENVSNG
jgi:hypothetical protein